MFKRWTMLLAIVAATALFAMVGTTIAAQKEATPKAQDNVAGGEPEVKKMLPLMDQDKDGKVSKQDLRHEGLYWRGSMGWGVSLIVLGVLCVAFNRKAQTAIEKLV